MIKKILGKWWILPLLIVGIYVGKYIYKLPAYSDGEAAPDFSWTTTNQEEVKLSDLKGNFVLLDFWGSWCGPCRAENPHLVKLYDKYHSANFKKIKGFEIVSVGIERGTKRWQAAIKKDNLKWQHHAFDETKSFKFFNSKIASQYSIKEVPTKYLINEKGAIVSVNPTVEQIDKILSAQL